MDVSPLRQVMQLTYLKTRVVQSNHISGLMELGKVFLGTGKDVDGDRMQNGLVASWVWQWQAIVDNGQADHPVVCFGQGWNSKTENNSKDIDSWKFWSCFTWGISVF